MITSQILTQLTSDLCVLMVRICQGYVSNPSELLNCHTCSDLKKYIYELHVNKNINVICATVKSVSAQTAGYDMFLPVCLELAFFYKCPTNVRRPGLANVPVSPVALLRVYFNRL